jgi:hypothetical protein
VTAVSTSIPETGPGKLVKVIVGPNPGDGRREAVYFQADGMISQVIVRIFGISGTLISQYDFTGSFQSGWNFIVLPGQDLANGLYFVDVEAGGVRKTAKLMVLR